MKIPENNDHLMEIELLSGHHTMAADALAPCIARSAAIMVLNIG